MPTPINPKSGFVSKPTSDVKPTRPGVPTGEGGKIAFADAGKVKTTTSTDARKG